VTGPETKSREESAELLEMEIQEASVMNAQQSNAPGVWPWHSPGG